MVWARTGGSAPLEQRYAALINRAAALGLAPAVPMSEENCDRLERAIAGREAPYQPPSPSMAAAIEAFREAVRRYAVLQADIIAKQKELKRAAKEPHVILSSLSDEMFIEPLRANQMVAGLGIFEGRSIASTHPDGTHTPAFESPEAARKAAQAVLGQCMILGGMLANIGQAFDFQHAPIEQQNRQLIYAIAQKLNVLRDRLNVVEAENTELKKALSTTQPRKGKRHA